MKNNKIIIILLIVVIAMLAIVIGTNVYTKLKCERSPYCHDFDWKEYVKDRSEDKDYIIPVSPVDTQKPIATTLPPKDLGGLGCASPLGGTPPPCNDNPPTHVILRGEYDGKGENPIVWFEYWARYPGSGDVGKKIYSQKIQQSQAIGRAEYYISDLSTLFWEGDYKPTLVRGGEYSYRIVVQTSGGITYGNTQNSVIREPATTQ